MGASARGLTGALLAAVFALPAVAAGITLESLLDEMTSLGRLAELSDPPFRAARASSYDRAAVAPDQPGWFGNVDHGNFVRVEQNGARTEYVLLDATGPGVVTRIWSSNPIGTLRVYVDGSPVPELEAPLPLLLGFYGHVEPFVPPLARWHSDGCNLHFPIGYASHVKVTVD
jgi:hypothetical protein